MNIFCELTLYNTGNDLRLFFFFISFRLSRYEKTNEMLINFNMLSSARCEATTQEFRQHTIVLGQMKADLDIVFRRIRYNVQREREREHNMHKLLYILI